MYETHSRTDYYVGLPVNRVYHAFGVVAGRYMRRRIQRSLREIS
ncbi:hypothetical protein [Methanoculleus sp.]